MIINGFNTIDGVITASPPASESTNERRGEPNKGSAFGAADYLLKTKAEFVDQPTLNPLSLPSNDFFASPRRTRVVWCACAVTRNGFVMCAEEGPKPRRILPSSPVRNRQMFERCFFVTLHRRRRTRAAVS